MSELSASDIGETFVPRGRGDLASVEVDGEVVLAMVDERTDEWRTHCLNQTGGIVWACFDGSGTLAELVVDLADAFGADANVVRDDVIELARQLGRAGLLEGVAPEAHEHRHWAEPESMPLGSEFPLFSLRDIDGDIVALESLAGHSVVLVNWSPHCSFCERIAAELVSLAPALGDRGAEVVLLALGDAEDNRRLAEEHGVEYRILLQDEAPVDAFAGVGTPSAYVIDELGRVASPLIVGADRVAALLHELAGEEAAETIP